MVKFFRFLAAVFLLIWLGTTIGISFYVAPSLFGNESGQVENSSVAGDIMSPLLRKMDLTAWVAIPLAMVSLIVAWKLSGGHRRKALTAALSLLGLALFASLYSGVVITQDIQQIRRELKEAYGGYHLAPKEDPERQRFGALHGQSMVLALGGLAMGFGAFYLATQVIGMPVKETENGGAEKTSASA